MTDRLRASCLPTGIRKPCPPSCLLADGPLLVEVVARSTAVDSAVEGIVGQRPVEHAARVPDLVALLQEAEVVHVLDVRVQGVDLLVVGQLVHHTDVHEDLIALTAPVEETFAASEPQGNVLAVPSATSAAHHSLRVDGGDQDGVLDGSEGADEGGGLQVLVQLDDTQDVLRSLVHNSETHVTAELLVGLLGEVLRIHDGALGADAPVPVGVDEPQALGVGGHQALDVLGHGLGVQLEVLREHSPPMAVSSAGLHLASCSHRRGQGLRNHRSSCSSADSSPSNSGKSHHGA
mmetsp:Transcript_3655/g.8510  ORF Transcript_3655/g.8510 Transcript_3655/m.8510 type:complete len:291 (-) Transcript_3655:70-942(-)